MENDAKMKIIGPTSLGQFLLMSKSDLMLTLKMVVMIF